MRDCREETIWQCLMPAIEIRALPACSAHPLCHACPSCSPTSACPQQTPLGQYASMVVEACERLHRAWHGACSGMQRMFGARRGAVGWVSAQVRTGGEEVVGEEAVLAEG